MRHIKIVVTIREKFLVLVGFSDQKLQMFQLLSRRNLTYIERHMELLYIFRQSAMVEFQDMIKDTFPNAVMDEQFGERVVYKIPQTDITSLAGCFSMLEKGKRF